MTFDEAVENINVLSAFGTVYGISPTVVRDIIRKLKEEYAPTVEMTSQQAKIFGSYYHPEIPVSKSKFDYPDSLLMSSITEKDLMQAWLHPETIKVVDE